MRGGRRAYRHSTNEHAARTRSGLSQTHLNYMNLLHFYCEIRNERAAVRCDRFLLRRFSSHRNHKDREIKLVNRNEWDAVNCHGLGVVKFFIFFFTSPSCGKVRTLTLTFNCHLRSASNIRVSWRLFRAARLLLNKSIFRVHAPPICFYCCVWNIFWTSLLNASLRS